MVNRNLQLLTAIAEVLRPLLDELVFLGGCSTALFITDPAAAQVRATYDVDAIAEIRSYAEYSAFSMRLRNLGFSEDTAEGAPICRWSYQQMSLDVMPVDGRVLGFSNRWYKPALEKFQVIQLHPGLSIRVVTAPYFLATKLEAFKNRGKDDFFSSHDLEDIIAVIDGRQSLIDELRRSSEELKEYVTGSISKLLLNADFQDALPGYLLPDPVSQARLHKLLATLQDLTHLNNG